MRIRVKICGITNRSDAEAAVEAGADAVGFILYEKSPRYITPEAAQEVIKFLPAFVETVAVMVNPTEEEISRVESVSHFSSWQYHGQESARFCAGRRMKRFIKAFGLPVSLSLEELAEYGASAFLLDTPSEKHGGTGRVFDWNLVEGFRQLTDKKIILSGGINFGNVVEAIQRVNPYAVDVSSGVESSPGKKDHRKIRELMEVCKKL